jgi:hypothetical protein
MLTSNLTDDFGTMYELELHWEQDVRPARPVWKRSSTCLRQTLVLTIQSDTHRTLVSAFDCRIFVVLCAIVVAKSFEGDAFEWNWWKTIGRPINACRLSAERSDCRRAVEVELQNKESLTKEIRSGWKCSVWISMMIANLDCLIRFRSKWMGRVAWESLDLLLVWSHLSQNHRNSSRYRLIWMVAQAICQWKTELNQKFKFCSVGKSVKRERNKVFLR